MLMAKYPALRYLVAVAIFILGALLLWLPAEVRAYSGYDKLTAMSEEVVNGVSTQNMTAFIAVSGIKSALAIIEDSSVGTGFSLQVGDAVQSVYDYVCFIWDMLLYSLMVLGVYKLLLETHLLYLGLQVIGGGMMVWGFGLAVQRVPGKLRILGQRVVLLGMLFAFVVPFALLATHYATTHYTGPLKAKHAEKINNVKAQLDTLTTQVGALKGEISLLNPLDSVDAIRRRITAITGSITGALQQSTQSMLYYIVIVLFELLVFPLISAYLLFKFLQFGLGRVLDRPMLVQPVAPPPPQPPQPAQPANV